MAELLRIEEPAAAPLPPPQWRAFLELGFRPLYLAGALWALVSIALWVFAPQWLAGPLGGVAWHAHEMLWGFVATIAVGFLLTAGANWTGMNPLHGPALGALTCLWVLARMGFLLPWQGAFVAAVACELLFFGWAAAALALAVLRTRNHRNAGVPLLLAALGVADALFLRSVRANGYEALTTYLLCGLLCMSAIALLIARRVIPFFAMRAVGGLAIPMHTRSGQWQLAAALAAPACLLAGWRPAAAAALLAAGAIALWQVLSWKPLAVRRVPLLWILYLGHACMGARLLVAAAHLAGGPLRAAWPVHAIGIAGFSVLIIGMITRTALGHLGRPLRTDRTMVAAYLLVITAAALRLAALLPTAMAGAALHASALAWVAAFALYLWRFAPLLVRPRADARPVPPPSLARIRRTAG